MRRLCWLILMALTCSGASADTLRGLLLTSPGVYHNYERQTTALARGVANLINVRFDVSLAEVERWRDTDYGRGYDVLVYNICMADNRDEALIYNMRRQTEVLGVPTVVLHCTMHSFRDTDLWWPLTGLRSHAHAPLGRVALTRVSAHPVLDGVPDDWVLAEDELYLNLAMEGQPLLVSTDAAGTEHVAAWLHRAGAGQVFGTTLGHSDLTMENDVYQRLVANGILHVTGWLTATGDIPLALAPVASDDGVLDAFSAPEGVGFLGDDGMACAFRRMGWAVAPCYVGCTLNPLKWGAAADACREGCNGHVPASDELIAACMPD